MRSRLWLLPLVALPVACMSPRDRARADSARALIVEQHQMLDKLAAQRDSVNQLLGDASTFIGKIDSSISRVKGLPGPSRAKRGSEGPLEDQLRNRKDMLRRVDALVDRARATAREVAELKQRQTELMTENGKLRAENGGLRDSLAAQAQQMAELTASIEKQAQMIIEMQGRLDDLGKELNVARASYSRAYYVIGTEDELLKKGVIVKEGGTNLLIKRVGRTLVPARDLKRDVFTSIDTREVHEIALPDTTKRYQIISRQSLDEVKVATREGTSFRGPLEIPDAEKFWAPSRYLIIVQR